MALNGMLNIQEIDLDTKELSSDLKVKEFELYWNDECKLYPSNNHCKIFCE